MKLRFLISGWNVPSSRFRLLQFIPHLQRAGHQVRVAASFPPKYDYYPWLGFRPSQLLKRASRLVDLTRAHVRRDDVIVVEREIFNDNSSWFEERFRRAAPGMVLDVDDGVFVSFPEKFERIARLSDVVIAGNPLIESYVRPMNPHVEVIPTCVDLDQYPKRPAKEAAGDGGVIIGWMGSTGNLNYLRTISGALRELARKTDFELRLVAPESDPLSDIDLEGVRINFVPWDPRTEVDQLLQFDIGLMPLEDDTWSRYKCGLKLIQYMAIGIPGVASPVGVNQQIVLQGVDGFLAETDEQWVNTLEELCRDAGMRQRVGEAARKKVEAQYSVQANVERLIACFEQAAG